jgi:hypothetical protein
MNHKGTGLGLSICKKLTKQMGGEVKVESILEKGSRFIISIGLPVVDTQLTNEQAPNMTEEQKVHILRKFGAFDYTPQFNIKYKSVFQPSVLEELDKNKKPLPFVKNPIQVKLESRLRTF